MINNFLKDIIKYLPAQIVPPIVGIIAMPIVTHLFPAQEYGNYILVIVTVDILISSIKWLSASVIRFYPAYERDKKLEDFYATVVELAVISIGLISFVFLVVLLYCKIYISLKLYSLMQIGIILFILLAAFELLLDFLRVKRQAIWYSGFMIYKSVSVISIGVLLVICFHLGVEGLLWGFVLSLLFALPFLWKKAIGKIFLVLKKSSLYLTKGMAKYGLPLIVAICAGKILSFGDRYVLGLFRGPSEVGIYSASYVVAEMAVMLIVFLFMLASEPIALSMWEREDKNKIREFISKLARYYLILALPVLVGLISLSKPIIAFLTAPEYHLGYKVIPWVSAGVFLFGLQHIFGIVFAFYKKTYIIMFLAFASSLLNIFLNFLFVPKYGYIAAAITTFISYVFLAVTVIIISRRMFLWRFPVKSLLKISLAAAIMSIVVYHIGNNPFLPLFINLILGIFSGIAVYSGVFFILKEIQEEEIKELRSIKGMILAKLRVR